MYSVIERERRNAEGGLDHLSFVQHLLFADNSSFHAKFLVSFLTGSVENLLELPTIGRLPAAESTKLHTVAPFMTSPCRCSSYRDAGHVSVW